MKNQSIYIQDCGIITAIGRGKAETARTLFAGSSHYLTQRSDLIPHKTIWVGAVTEGQSTISATHRDTDNRNNRVMEAALVQITSAVEVTKLRYGHDRVAVIVGTSTSGIANGEEALEAHQETGAWPTSFHYHQQELGNLSAFVAKYFGLTGPAYTIATACSSSAKVFASARRLIAMGLVDAAVVGGADTLCRTTLNGFDALELLSAERCNPFSVNRKGINIGEGASVFLLTKEKGPVQLLGVGETSDAHHPTAPLPDGAGAYEAMQKALQDAGLAPTDIAYINLHGTATPLNDAMEARAVFDLCGDQIPCGSTKGMTGHMLGATGGCEAAFLWLCLNPVFNPDRQLPPHIWDGMTDPSLPSLAFVEPRSLLPQRQPLAMLSNSFGFGGSNVSLVLGHSN